MDKKNMILGIVAILLFAFVIFSTFRGGITAAAVYCDDCSQPEDCEEYCYDYCIKKGYDVVTSTGIESAGNVECECSCESYLNNIVTGK